MPALDKGADAMKNVILTPNPYRDKNFADWSEPPCRF